LSAQKVVALPYDIVCVICFEKSGEIAEILGLAALDKSTVKCEIDFVNNGRRQNYGRNEK